LSSDQEASEPFQAKIAPWLSVRRCAEAVDYYKAAFGAVELHRVENDAGEIVAQLSAGGADFWVADDPDHSPEVLGVGSVRMILTVEDPDKVFERAVSAGASVVAAMYEDHGWRIGRVADPFGHHWEIARPLAPGR
jgi:PhnB protein